VVLLAGELARLPRWQREALVLRHVVGLSPEEAGTVMGCSAQAVRNLTYRGTAELRSRLGAAPEEVGDVP
jgi:DNA-directed RNA polymerase specialized sigma24 family protein